MRAAWLICAKDLRARLRDRSAVLIGDRGPARPGVHLQLDLQRDLRRLDVISLGVVNADHGAVSQQFTSQVLPAVGRSGLIAIHPEATVARARALAAKGTLAAVIVIPAGFSARVQAGQPASMQVIGNVDAPISTEVARSIAESFAADLNRIRLSVATVAAGTTPRVARADPGARRPGRRGRRAGGGQRRVRADEGTRPEVVLRRGDGRVLPVLHRPVRRDQPARGAQRRDAGPAAGRPDQPGLDPRREAADELPARASSA